MKRKQTPKAAAASKKNLEVWEKKQAMMNRLSDNKEMMLIGFVLGAVTVLLACMVALGIVFAV